MTAQPVISAADAAETCAQPWPTPDAAREQLRILRAAGWAVLESTGATPRPDGLVVVASVYHPVTWESPGDLLCHTDSLAMGAGVERRSS